MKTILVSLALALEVASVSAEGLGPYSTDQLRLLATFKQAVARDDSGFVVEGGRIHRVVDDRNVEDVAGPSNVAEVLWYGDQLVARTSDGGVWTWVPDEETGAREWHRIHDHAVALIADCEDLFALTERARWLSSEPRRRAWRYDRRSRDEAWVKRSRVTVVTAGKSTIPVFEDEVTSADERVEFGRLRVDHPTELVLRDGVVSARTADGLVRISR